MKLRETIRAKRKDYGYRYAASFFALLQIIIAVLVVFMTYKKVPHVIPLTLASLTLSLIISYYVIFQIFSPLDKLLDYIEMLKTGNLSTSLDFQANNEINDLLTTVDELRTRFDFVIKEQREIEKKRKQLIARTSHDLKTPLTSIIGYVEALQDGIAKNPDDYLNIIHQKSTYLNQLINDLSTYSKQEVGEIIINKEKLLLSTLLERYLRQARKTAELQGIRLVEHTPFVQTFIDVDPYRFNQIMENLFSNALKYTKTTIEISTGILSNQVEITIKDDGIGISEEYINSIFDPFFMINKVADFREKGGSGLGLAIVKQLTELHSGSIRAYSTYGKGATFIISLPISY